MAKDKDYRGNGKEHRVYLKSLTLVYWGKGVATATMTPRKSECWGLWAARSNWRYLRRSLCFAR